MDFRKPGSQTEENSFLGFESQFKGESNGYPGGLYFDPLGFSRWVETGHNANQWHVSR